MVDQPVELGFGDRFSGICAVMSDSLQNRLAIPDDGMKEVARCSTDRVLNGIYLNSSRALHALQCGEPKRCASRDEFVARAVWPFHSGSDPEVAEQPILTSYRICAANCDDIAIRLCGILHEIHRAPIKHIKRAKSLKWNVTSRCGSPDEVPFAAHAFKRLQAIEQSVLYESIVRRAAKNVRKPAVRESRQRQHHLLIGKSHEL